MDNFKIALGVSRAQSMHKQYARGEARPTMHCIRLVNEMYTENVPMHNRPAKLSSDSNNLDY